ncbi:FHA domain-containing protein [Aquisphaera insulae]|uniref:FHA domain-containing protein n=1 Tax=Aquisphaera insulae TaxID=2712864 RepID=UPI0013ECB0A4|nr:FHA domain-containing protein [Aquisphaera insulae]
MKAELVPENGDPPIPITSDLAVVGRRGYCDIVIDHPSLSKRHCVVVKTDGLLVIRDLISTNGTKVKGQRIRWAALLPDDRIAFGNYKLRVYLGPDDVPSPSDRFRAKGLGAPLVGPSRGNDSAPAAVGFPEPSPLELGVWESDELPVADLVDEAPMLPIVLDDSDEIIDLD